MNWELSDTARFKEYNNRTGGRLRAYMASLIPMHLGMTSIEQVALCAKYKEGCEFMLKAIDDILAESPQQEDASAGGFTSM